MLINVLVKLLVISPSRRLQHLCPGREGMVREVMVREGMVRERSWLDRLTGLRCVLTLPSALRLEYTEQHRTTQNNTEILCYSVLFCVIL